MGVDVISHLSSSKDFCSSLAHLQTSPEGLDFGHISGSRPVLDACDFNQVHCHDMFPLLSPTSTLLHKPHQSHLTDPSQNFPNLIGPLDQSRSHLTGHLGPHVVASQASTRTPFGTDFAGLRDRMAFQDHMVIT